MKRDNNPTVPLDAGGLIVHTTDDGQKREIEVSSSTMFPLGYFAAYNESTEVAKGITNSNQTHVVKNIESV